MPTYDYKCNACDHTFELFQSMTAKHEKKCPSCGKLALERLIGTGAALIFKGAGFYQTDYRTESYKKGETAAKESSKPAVSSTSDSKPAAAAESKPAKSEPTPAATKSESKPAQSESKPASKSATKSAKK
ncbi:MAG: zinc ribbon domain-containing protein [Planctomycetes bacterium]|nr:zinc ribbon domain-containing protein [Planctomycetota bacterium]